MRRGVVWVPTEDFTQLQLQFVDHTQWRYEVICLVVLFADRTPQQRSQETRPHPATVRTLARRFRQLSMLELLPDNVEVVIQGRMTRVPDPVRQEIDRLKALYEGFHYRELACILFVKLGYPVDDKTVKKLWQQSPVSCQGRSSPWDYHGHPDRYQARLEVVKLYYHGWAKMSISRFLRVSRPTVDARIQRFEAEHFAGLMDKRRGLKAPCKVWLPLMVQVYHLQKVHPDAGEFRIWSLLARPDISMRTIGQVMAFRLVYDDIPHVPKKRCEAGSGAAPVQSPLSASLLGAPHRRCGGVLSRITSYEEILYAPTLSLPAMV
jgi:hypothetical protein